MTVDKGKPVDAQGPTELDKDSTATVAFVFDGVLPRGSVNLEGCLGDLCDPLEAKLKVG